MSSQPIPRQLWYVRKGGRTQGPIPHEQVAHEILLGRIRKNDEISADGQHWQHPNTLPQLVPEVMKHADTKEARQHLLLARLREDERQSARRHGAGHVPVDSSRRLGDRRTVESFDVTPPPEMKTRPAGDVDEAEFSLLLPAALLLTALFVLAMYLW